LAISASRLRIGRWPTCSGAPRIAPAGGLAPRPGRRACAFPSVNGWFGRTSLSRDCGLWIERRSGSKAPGPFGGGTGRRRGCTSGLAGLGRASGAKSCNTCCRSRGERRWIWRRSCSSVNVGPASCGKDLSAAGESAAEIGRNRANRATAAIEKEDRFMECDKLQFDVTKVSDAWAGSWVTSDPVQLWIKVVRPQPRLWTPPELHSPNIYKPGRRGPVRRQSSGVKSSMLRESVLNSFKPMTAGGG
jgi:hypothetical protein